MIKQGQRKVAVNKKRLIAEHSKDGQGKKAIRPETAKPEPAGETMEEKKEPKTEDVEGEEEEEEEEGAGEIEEHGEKEDIVTPEEEAAMESAAEKALAEGKDPMDMSELNEALRVWNPSEGMAKDEQLVCEPSAYDMLHRLTAEWPSLSFDIVRDSFGTARGRYPHTMLLAAGTQADNSAQNKVCLMRVAQLCRTKHDKGEDDNDDSDSDSDSDDSDSDNDLDPVLDVREIRHRGCVNRLRVHRNVPRLLATWSDTGKVHVFDIAPWLAVMDRVPGEEGDDQAFAAAAVELQQKPLFTFKHKCEGFAMDWNVCDTSSARLVTGDCSGAIYVWHGCERAGGSATSQGPFLGHRGSVEDLQWSPSEATIFASCSTDRTIRIWDAREKAGSVLRTCEKAHDADVNVISWNRKQNFLLASGGDDGTFRVWDLRNVQDSIPISDFRYHSKPITSIEWSPEEESVLAVSSADNSISIWDLSLEEDTEDTAQAEGADMGDMDVPPQLMFVHMGQEDIKELHWHPQIPNTIVSTALDGFNIFKPANL